MQAPLQIAFRGMETSPAVEARIRERIERLERHCDRLVSCRVVVEAPHRHHHKGKLYTVKVQLSVPGRDIEAGNGSHDHAHEDLYVAIRDAFDAADQRLEDYVRRVRGDVKTHEAH